MKELFNNGNFNKALLETENLNDSIEQKIWKSFILSALGKLEESLSIAEQVIQETQSDASSQKLAELIKASIIWRHGRIDEVNVIMDKFEEGFSLKYLDQQWNHFYYLTYGMLYLEQGNLESAKHYFMKASDLAKLNDFIPNLAGIYNNLGVVTMYQGDLNEAMAYFQQSLEINQKLETRFAMANNFNNIGNIHYNRGDIESALPYYIRAFEIHTDLDNQAFVALSQGNFGLCYYQLNEIEKCIEHFEKCLEISKKIGNDSTIAQVLYELVLATSELNLHEQSKQYRLELGEMAKNTANNRTLLLDKLSSTLLLRRSNRIMDKAEAQKNLEAIVGDKPVYHELTVIAIINLIEMLIDEMGNSNQLEILIEIDYHLKQLIALAESQNMTKTNSEALFLQAKLQILNEDIDLARSLLTKAQEIADDAGLIRLANLISYQHDLLLEGDPTQETNHDTIIVKMNQYQITNTISSMLNKEVLPEIDILPEIPYLFAIFDSNLELIYQKKFTLNYIEDNLLYGVMDFIKEYTRDMDGTYRFRFNTLNGIVQTSHELKILYLYKGKSYLANQRISTFKESLNLQLYSSQFSNQPHQIASSLEMIAFSMFETEQSTDEIVDFTKQTLVPSERASDITIHEKLSEFQELFHPIRLSILKYLSGNLKVSRSELTSFLKIKSGTLETHLTYLIKYDYITSDYEFIGDKPRKMIYINPKTIQIYSNFKKVIQATL